MATTPQTRYATAPDGVSIAYQVVGDGPLDLIWVPGWISHVEAAWEEPTLARFFERLASFSRLIGTAGDGFLATFDGPARAVRCGLACVESVRQIGLEIRAGVHIGEIELVGSDVRGLAVHIGARIGALAGPGQVLVSRTVKDLVVGSGLAFIDYGIHQLKGVPDDWQIFSVSPG